MFESLWSDDVAQIASSRIPKNLRGQERIDFYKQRTQAQDLIKALFPPDEETNGES